MSRRFLFTALLPLLLIVALPAFAQKRGAKGNTKGASPSAVRPVAVVNGTVIPYGDYEDLRQDQLSYQRRDGRPETIDPLIDDQLFLQLVDAELVRQEAGKRKIAVTRDEAVKLLIQNPPKFLRDLFLDDKGVFQKEYFAMVVHDPSKIAQFAIAGHSTDSTVAQWRHDLEKVIRFVEDAENKKRLAAALLKENPLTPQAIKGRYFAENTYLSGSFVRVLHSTIPDSEVPVSEAEARAWYESHKEDYRVPPARWISSAIIPIYPLPVDSARQHATIDSVTKLVNESPLASRAETVTRVLRALPPNRFPADQAIMARQLPEDAIPMVRNAKAGDLVGPIQLRDETVYFYIDEVVPSKDTLIRASHLLLRVAANDPSSDSVNFQLASALKDAIKSDQQFIEAAHIYGQDGSAKKGGDLGYFGRGRMVHEFDSAAFLGNIGDMIGPVKTRFGYHVIRITDKLTNAYRIRELRFPLAPSDEANRRARIEAESYASFLRNGGNADSAVGALRARYPGVLFDTSMVKRLEPYADALAMTEFAFNAKIGDIAVIPLPYNRIAVTQLLRTWEGGVPKYDEIPAYPLAHARRAKQLEMLKPRIAKLADSLQPEMLLGPMRSIAPMAEVFLINNQIANEPPDESPTILDSMIAVAVPNHVYGPVRGKHGYYFLRVLERNGPSNVDFNREREEYTRTYTARYQQNLLDDLIKKDRTFADLSDQRPFTRSVLAQREHADNQ
jgi:peptidylprolyl isomerase/peptidyl-prolyl cis-trans isomerase D